MHNNKIAYFYGAFEHTYIRTDYDILKEKYDVVPIQIKNILDLYKLIKPCLFADFILSWFPSERSAMAVFLSKLFNKKSGIIGSTISLLEGDVGAKEKKLKFRKSLRICAKYSVEKADIFFPVSQYEEVNTQKHCKPQKTVMIHHGFDANNFTYGAEKEDLILMVSYINEEYIIRKRIIEYINVAKELPEYKFQLIGKSFDIKSYKRLVSQIPNNMEIVMPGEDTILQAMKKAKIYMQISISEGFGCAVAEAMLCGCVPVVSLLPPLMEIVQDKGYLIDDFDPKHISSVLKQALKDNKYLEKRKHIIDNFSLEMRKMKMVSAIEEVLSNATKK